MNVQQQEVWYKAAVIGSIWASFEIVFGSFFHSLRLPFAGTFLTFTSIVLLISFSYKWNDKNLFIKAGIIAALMRSLMPTSVILGPLIGIMIEAILFQLVLRLLGRNLFSFTVAGVLAMFSAIIHKVVSIILIYGFDIVKILKNLYFVMMKTTHIHLPLHQLLWVVLISYTLIGFLSALIGISVGKKVLTLSKETPTGFKRHLSINNTLFDVKGFRYRPFFIFLHIVALVLFLMGLEFFSLQWIVLPLILYLSYIIYRYGKALRRLAKPLFWLQLAVIVLMAIWLWQDKSEGLLVGIKMILRAILVVSVFTAISVELKNPLVKALLYKKGYSHLYISLGLATAAVPFILKNLATDKKSLLRPFKVLKNAIALSDVLLQEFKSFSGQNKSIYIISGDTRSGKTTFLKQVLNEVKRKKPDIGIGGIIAHGLDKDGERFGFDIENLATGERRRLCSVVPVEKARKIGRFYFDETAFDFGNEALNIRNGNDLVVVDEIGYMELEGKGWFEAVDKLVKSNETALILVVRRRLLEQFLRLWQDANIRVIDIDKNQPEDLVKSL